MRQSSYIFGKWKEIEKVDCDWDKSIACIKGTYSCSALKDILKNAVILFLINAECL